MRDEAERNAGASERVRTRVTKGEVERYILDLVYPKSKFEIIPQDKPDFILKQQERSTAFGVEITTLYRSESDARLSFIPDYFTDIIYRGHYRHKDDINELRVTHVTVTDEDGTVTHENLPGILRQNPENSVYQKALASIILEKTRKSVSYTDGLDHLELVILDRAAPQSDANSAYSVTDLLSEGVREALLQSNFHEVFLAMPTSNKTSTYRPLQLILLLESFYMFCGAAESYSEENGGLEEQHLVPLFIHMQQNQGLDVKHAVVNEKDVAVYRFSGIGIQDGGISVLDYPHGPGPEISTGPPSVPDSLRESFLPYYESFVQSNGFSAAMWTPGPHRSDPAPAPI
ncbi:hypothetical protein [Lentzea sp. NPDC092896]|uniref:hypothetical protein n=1 Tax=Lentzea sp. NPDC092896 TaxID=3364127 RepID=UPI0037F735A4